MTAFQGMSQGPRTSLKGGERPDGSAALDPYRKS